MKKLVNKAVHTYRNQGAQALTKKSLRFAYRKTADTFLKKREQGLYADLWEEYGFITNPIFQINSQDIQASNATVKASKLTVIKSANWFVPNFDHISFGGIFTIFRFIEKFAEEGVTNRIIIYDNPSFDKGKLKEQIESKFPKLMNYEIVIFDHSSQDVNELPECDVAICSFWVSAYLLLKFNKTKRKYYFIQDYEPLFYAGGSTYALAESTYRFGFRALVNTPGLLAAVNKRHGMEGISFVPAVDQSVYYPNTDKRPSSKVRIFFYARPNNPRNAFNLGIAIIKQLIDMYGDKIEIITAGAEWKEAAYGLRGKITNLGLLGSREEVGELYRSCDIGFVYMLSKHPSYQPFEFMASGVATVSNNNEDNLWFLQDGTNALVAEPSPAAMTEKIGWLIDDEALRTKIRNGGFETIKSDWSAQLDLIWNDITKT